jgi:nicotinamide-nucleotide amidase
MLPQETLDLAERVLAACRARGLKIATAESCTGGLIAAALTHIPGSSDVFERGFVTYSNEAKTGCLGVPANLIAEHGAVSEQVARAMALGVLEVCSAELTIAVTGIAGPGGGSVEKPVGLVWFGFAQRGKHCRTESRIFPGDRSEIRAQAVAFALGWHNELLK